MNPISCIGKGEQLEQADELDQGADRDGSGRHPPRPDREQHDDPDDGDGVEGREERGPQPPDLDPLDPEGSACKASRSTSAPPGRAS